MSGVKRVYIAGPMSGLESFNLPAFDSMAYTLRRMGYEVVSPADISRAMITERGCGFSDIRRGEYLTRDLAELQLCDAMVLLPGWQRSAGVDIELRFAAYCGIVVYDGLEALRSAA
jgi:nucleoside 2-deoxyribosyltransferase